MTFSTDYQKKIDCCRNAITSLSIQVDAIYNKYEGECFVDSPVSKAQAFAEVMRKCLSKEVFELFNTRCDLPRFKDRRQPFEYATDLVLGWLIEDAILLHITDRGLSVSLDGEDRFREFLSPQKISTQPDLKVVLTTKIRVVEIFADWKDTWNLKNHADLRDSKLLKLRREQALMLGIAPLSGQGFLFDFESGDNGFVSTFIPAYSKLGYSNQNIRAYLMPFSSAVDVLVNKFA